MAAGNGLVWRVAGLLLLVAAVVALAPSVAATTLTGRAPTATDDTGYSTNSGAPVVPLAVAAPGLLANDVDPDTPLSGLTAIKVTDPANGTVTVNANGAFTYTPTANFAGTDSFTYKVNDGTADSNAATVTITVIAPPTVTSTTPTNNAVDVLATTTITVTFSVPVNVTGSAFTLECPSGTSKTFSVSPASPAASYTLTPSAALPASTVCTVTVVANQVTSAATGTAMSANYVFSFTVDTPPSVTTTTPANGATAVLTNATITVNFDKAVNASTSSFTLECPTGTSKTFSLSPAGPATSYTLTPSANLPGGTVCTVTVVAANVTDAAGTAMVSNTAFSFTTETPPAVTTTTPANTATDVRTNATITVNFDRSVNVTGSAFTLECPSGTSKTFSVSPASPAASYTLTPSAALPASTVCTVTVVANQVTSAATGTAMSANYVFSFTVDTPPTVTTTTPANNAISVAPSSTITVNFSKSVNASTSSFTLECPTGTSKTFTLSPAGPATSYTLTPSASLPADTVCTVTVVAANVTDVPGEPMTSNYTFSFATPPVASNDTYPQTVIGNVSIDSAAIPYSATGNDTFTLPVTVTAFDTTSAQGGTVSMTASGAGLGQFTYNPPAGYTGTDTFTYTIANAHGSSTATVSVPISGMIWFINASAATNGDGRLSSPFNSLAAFQAVNNGSGNNPAANDNIFLYESGTAYGSGVVLLSGQKLIGQDATASLATITGLTPESGSAALPAMNTGAPSTTIGGTVIVANGVTVRGLTVSAAASTAVIGTSITTATIGADVTITTTTGTGVSLSGGNGAIDIGAPITTTGGRSVQVQNRTGGTTTFSGAISDSGTGISLTNNGGGTGTTITFTGGVAVSSGANTAFTATGGGTVNVCATTSCGSGSAVVNTLTTTTGTALNVANTTIGTSGLTFTSISAGTTTGGPVNGIVLNNTGAGGLTVEGNGASSAADTTRGRTASNRGSGGTIQKTSGAGILLTNTQNVVLRNMNVQNGTGGVNSGGDGINASAVSGLTLDNTLITGFAGNSGLRGVGVSNLTMQHVEISANGTTTGVESTNNWNVFLQDLAGSSGTWQNSLFYNSRENVVGLQQGVTNGTVSLTLTVTNSEFRDTLTVNPGNVTFGISAFNGATTNITVTGSTFRNAKATGFQYAGNNDAAGTVNVRTSVFDQNGVDIDLAHQGGAPSAGSTARLDFDVSGNTTRQTFKAGSSVSINLFLAGNSKSGALMSGTVVGNVVGNAGVAKSGSDLGAGISVNATGAGTLTTRVTGNTVVEVKQDYAFFAEANSGAARLNLKANNNTFKTSVLNPGLGLAGMGLVSGAVGTDSSTLYVEMSGNTLAGDSTYTGIELTETGGASSQMLLLNYSGPDNNTGQISAYAVSQNASVTPQPPFVTIGTGGGVIRGTATPVTFP